MSIFFDKSAALQRLRKLEKKRKQYRPLSGASPGQLREDATASKTSAILRKYTETASSVQEITSFKILDDILLVRSNEQILWIDIQGLADIEIIKKLGQQFGLHSLVISDLVHTGQRPKTEIHEDYILVILREPRSGPPFDSEQIAIVIGKGFVLTFQERHGDIFEPVRQRMDAGSKRMQELGASYLAYALIDTIIDEYFPILEGYGELTEKLEHQLISEPNPHLITDIHVLKRELLDMRRALWSQREAVSLLLRDETDLISDGMKIYLRDCADHSFQLLDMIEVYREVSQGLVDLHLASGAKRMNEIMKVLTIIATIFIPMTFIAGLYGMNFDRASPYNLPELSWAFGYFFALGIMAASAITMLIYFWRKGWIGKR